MDAGWLDVRDEVVEFFEHKRRQQLLPYASKRFCEEIFPVWKSSWTMHTSDVNDLHALARMRPADFLLMDCVKDAVTGTGIEWCVIESYYELLQEELGDLVKRWHAARRAELNDMLKKAIPSLSANPDPVTLAICTFDCANPRCTKKLMHYPDVLDHRCSWNMRKSHRKEDETYKFAIQQEMVRADGMCRAWDKDHVRVSKIARTSGTRTIVVVYGCDPDDATPRDLDEAGARLPCAGCVPKPNARRFDWRKAVRSLFSFDVFVRNN